MFVRLQSQSVQNFEQATVCHGILVGVGFSAPAIQIDGGNQLDVVVIPSGLPPNTAKVNEISI